MEVVDVVVDVVVVVEVLVVGRVAVAVRVTVAGAPALAVAVVLFSGLADVVVFVALPVVPAVRVVVGDVTDWAMLLAALRAPPEPHPPIRTAQMPTSIAATAGCLRRSGIEPHARSENAARIDQIG